MELDIDAPPPPPVPPSASSSTLSMLSSCAPGPSPNTPMSTPPLVSPMLPVVQYGSGDVQPLSQLPSPYGVLTSTATSTHRTSQTLSGSPSSPSSADANANANANLMITQRPSLDLALAPVTTFVPASASASAVGANSINNYAQPGPLQDAALTTSSLRIPKPFTCPICNRSYRQANGLKYHLMHGKCDLVRPKTLEHVKDLRGTAVQGAGQIQTMNTGSSVPGAHGAAAVPQIPTAPRAGVVIPQAPKQAESWRRNPAYKGRDGAEAPWIPGQSMPHREHLQLVRGASFNQYKFVPPPPSAEYLAMKLSDNPLGLTDLTPVSIEEYYLQGLSKPNMFPLDDDPNIDGGNDRWPTHLNRGGSSTTSSPSSNAPSISSLTTSTSPSSLTMPQHTANSYSSPPHLQDPHLYSPTRTQENNCANVYDSLPPKPTFSPKIARLPTHCRSLSPLRESASANSTAMAPRTTTSSSPRASLTSSNTRNERGNDQEKDMDVYTNTETNRRPHRGEWRPESANRSHSPHARRNSHMFPTGGGAEASTATADLSRLIASAPLRAHAISPSPHDAQRPTRVRLGYWNQRGDHLTPDRYIVYAPPDKAFPPELATYPPEEVGYRNHDGALCPWAERPELPESLPRRGRVPERPYEDFVVYVDRAPIESLARPGSRRSSIDSPPLSEHIAERRRRRRHASTAALSSSSESNFMGKDEAGVLPKAAPPPSRVDPWDLDARLAALSSKRPKSPTSSSSSYGSPQSVRSRASSWSCSPGGHHIPGTSRDILEFPFGYPTTPI